MLYHFIVTQLCLVLWSITAAVWMLLVGETGADLDSGFQE